MTEQHPMVGRTLTSADSEPPIGTIVKCLGEKWGNLGEYWVALDRDSDPETWRKIAGNYGPVTVLKWAKPMARDGVATQLPEVVPVRALFEALLDGCSVVAESDEATARTLLTGLAQSLSDHISAIASALKSGPGALIECGLEPPSVVSLRGGILKIYKPGCLPK